jgi:hypothetical protein
MCEEFPEEQKVECLIVLEKLAKSNTLLNPKLSAS